MERSQNRVVVVVELLSRKGWLVMEEDCCSTQLIDGDGRFNVVGLENFTKTTKFSQRGLSYAVVAIMGPQSSGRILKFLM